MVCWSGCPILCTLRLRRCLPLSLRPSFPPSLPPSLSPRVYLCDNPPPHRLCMFVHVCADAVYLARWSDAPVSRASIQDNLPKIRSKRARVAECLTRVAPVRQTAPACCAPRAQTAVAADMPGRCVRSLVVQACRRALRINSAAACCRRCLLLPLLLVTPLLTHTHACPSPTSSDCTCLHPNCLHTQTTGQ